MLDIPEIFSKLLRYRMPINNDITRHYGRVYDQFYKHKTNRIKPYIFII